MAVNNLFPLESSFVHILASFCFMFAVCCISFRFCYSLKPDNLRFVDSNRSFFLCVIDCIFHWEYQFRNYLSFVFCSLATTFVWINSALSSLWVNLYDDWVKHIFSSNRLTAVLIGRTVFLILYSFLFVFLLACCSFTILRAVWQFLRWRLTEFSEDRLLVRNTLYQHWK